MVDPITSLTITADPYGGALILEWVYPDDMPTSWKLYIFKKADSAPEDTDIAKWFAGQLTNDQLKELGLFVFQNIPQTISYQSFYDLTVKNTVPYYYKAVIKNLDDEELSANVSANGTPSPNFAINVIDGKSIVYNAVAKVINSLTSYEGNKPKIPLDISINRNYSPMKPDDTAFQVVVSRGAGQLANQSFSQRFGVDGRNLVQGVIDKDVITVEWICVGDPLRRDNFTSIMRVMRPIMFHYIMKMGNNNVQSVSFIMGGDGQAMPENGANLLTGMMSVALDIQNQLQIGNAITKLPLESITTNYEAD